jgi:septal ring-binding cell division protein DamX
MSEAVASALEEISGYQELLTLETRKADLCGQLEADDFASPELKAAYEQGLVAIAERSSDLAMKPELQNGIAAVGVQAIKGFNQLKPLEGILPSEQLADMREAVQTNLVAAADYYEKYGALTEASQNFMTLLAAGGVAVSNAQEQADQPRQPEAAVAIAAREEDVSQVQPPAAASVEPTAPASPAQPEAARTPRCISLALSPTGVYIGLRRGGRYVPYGSPGTFPERADYSIARRKALEFMATNGRDGVTSHEIWDAVFEGSRPFNRNTLKYVWSWLEGLKYHSQPIFQSNGKRGMGARYQISPSFDIDMTERVDRTRHSARTESTGPASEKQEPQIPLAEQTIGGLRYGSLYVLGEKLLGLNHVLADYEMPTISRELVAGLREYRPNLSALCNDEQKLLEYRETVLGEVQAIFEDEAKFEALVECLDENTTAEALVEYLYDLLDKPEDLQFVSRLISSHKVTMHIDQGGKGSTEVQGHQIIDQQGRTIWPIPAPARQSAPSSERDEPSSLSQPSAAVSVPTPAHTATPAGQPPAPASSDIQPEQSVATTPTRRPSHADARPTSTQQTSTGNTQRQPAAEPAPRSKRGREHRSSQGRQLQLQAMEERAKELAEAFIDKFGVDGTATINQLETVFNGFGHRALTVGDNGSRHRARRSKVGSRNATHMQYSVKNVLNVLLRTDPRFASAVSLRANKRQIESIYERAVMAVVGE